MFVPVSDILGNCCHPTNIKHVFSCLCLAQPFSRQVSSATLVSYSLSLWPNFYWIWVSASLSSPTLAHYSQTLHLPSGNNTNVILEVFCTHQDLRSFLQNTCPFLSHKFAFMLCLPSSSGFKVLEGRNHVSPDNFSWRCNITLFRVSERGTVF